MKSLQCAHLGAAVSPWFQHLPRSQERQKVRLEVSPRAVQREVGVGGGEEGGYTDAEAGHVYGEGAGRLPARAAIEIFIFW